MTVFVKIIVLFVSLCDWYCIGICDLHCLFVCLGPMLRRRVRGQYQGERGEVSAKNVISQEDCMYILCFFL